MIKKEIKIEIVLFYKIYKLTLLIFTNFSLNIAINNLKNNKSLNRII